MTIERIILILILWAVCFVMLPLQLGSNSSLTSPVGPDAYMRLERINQLVKTGDWFEHRIERAGPVEGADLHWTRPMDALVLAGAAPLLPFMEIRQAIEKAGILFPAAMSLILVFLSIWAVRPLVSSENLIWVVLLLAVQPMIQNYMALGRVDHHPLLAVLTAAVVGCLIRINSMGRHSQIATVAGALGGLGLWVSLEFLIVFVPAILGLGICWLLWGQPWRRINRNFAVSALLVCLVGFMIEIQPQGWFVARYDHLSIAQVFLVFCPAVFWLVLAPLFDSMPLFSRRLAGAAIYAAICLAVIFWLFSNLFVGPIAEVDPRIISIWIDSVSEMAPLYERPKQIVANLLLGLIASVYGLTVIFSKSSTSNQKAIWVCLVVLLLCTGGLALAHIRAALYYSVIAVIAAVPLLAALLDRGTNMFRGWRKGATGLLIRALIILGPFSLAYIINGVEGSLKPAEARTAEKNPKAQCKVREVTETLSSDTFMAVNGTARFVNNIDFGPELVYRTPHSFLAVPYHRNGDSIFDTYEILTSENIDRSIELLDKNEIGYILLCPNSSEKSYYRKSEETESLYNRLLKGELQEYFNVVQVPEPWRLYKYKVEAQ